MVIIFISRQSNLVGNVLNVNTGDWVRRDSGVGAGIDSYYEYVAKVRFTLRWYLPELLLICSEVDPDPDLYAGPRIRNIQYLGSRLLGKWWRCWESRLLWVFL